MKKAKLRELRALLENAIPEDKKKISQEKALKDIVKDKTIKEKRKTKRKIKQLSTKLTNETIVKSVLRENA